MRRLADQTSATQAIAASLGGFRAWLLHGVTGSGKTEVYLHLIAQVLESGGQALCWCPRSASRRSSRRAFARPSRSAIAMLHSALETWRGRSLAGSGAAGDAGIVLGTRLAVLAPLPSSR